MAEGNIKTISTNKKAFHDYFIEESMEAGIELTGTEVKSLRAGGVNLRDAWCSIDHGEMLLCGMHISPYDHGNIFNRDPLRVRRAAAAQAGNHALVWPDQAAGIYADSAVGVFQGLACEGAGWPVPRQKAVRQA